MKVVGAKVVTNARSPGARCYGFVTMSTSDEATKCISHLHRTELHGRMISVEKVRPFLALLLNRAHRSEDLVPEPFYLCCILGQKWTCWEKAIWQKRMWSEEGKIVQCWQTSFCGDQNRKVKCFLKIFLLGGGQVGSHRITHEISMCPFHRQPHQLLI